MLNTLNEPMTDRLLTPQVVELMELLCGHFAKQRINVLEFNAKRRTLLGTGEVRHLEDTIRIREANWTVEPVPAELLERRVELIGGCTRQEIIEGMNAGAKSYVADLCNMSLGDSTSILRAHKNLERAAENKLSYVGQDGDRIRTNPKSTTRLMIVPRPLSLMELATTPTIGPVPASFFDLALFATFSAEKLRLRQGGVYLYLREIGGHLEARLWNDVFDLIEERLSLPRGTFRATVILDSLAGALEADEILFELMHHSAGLSLDPQRFAADHLALFDSPDLPCMPDRQHIGLNAHFLRSVSLMTISICHKRQAHAMGAPSFVIPADKLGTLKAAYLEMIADKEREAVDGHDGTLVAHPGLVNPAMMEFNKSMPRSHQMYYQRPDTSTPADLLQRPSGPLSTIGLVAAIRTVLRALVIRGADGTATIIQGGRAHDRSSVRLSTMLLWHWTRCSNASITETGLVVNKELIQYLIKKEGGKMFGKADAPIRDRMKEAVSWLLEVIISPDVPEDLLDRAHG